MGGPEREKLIAMKEKGKSKQKRMYGAGRKARDPEMEEELFEWFVNCTAITFMCRSRRMICHQAKSVSTDDF